MNRAGVYQRLLRSLRPYVWPHFLIAVICMLVYSSTNGVLPFLVEHVFDDIFGKRDPRLLYLLPVAIIAIFVVRGLASFGNSYLMEWVGQRIITDLRAELNDKVQHLPLSYFNRTPTGTILSRMTTDVTLVRQALIEATVSVMKDGTSLIVLVVVAFLKDWVLALIAFVAFPLAVIPVLRLSKRLRRTSRTGQQTLGNLTALLQETIQGNRIVKAFGMEEYEKRRFAAENERVLAFGLRASRIKSFIPPTMELLAALGIAGVIWYGGWSVISGGRTQGSFLGFLLALFLVYDPFKGLAKTNGMIQQGLASADRVFELLDEPTDVPERPGAPRLAAFEHGIAFEGVSFRYPPRRRAGDDGEAAASELKAGLPSRGEASVATDDAPPRDWALVDVDLHIRKGEAVALVGPSGGGKSTLSDLIPRFYDPTSGRVTIDGHDLRELDLSSLRAQIGIVTQFTFLFNDTIKANIAYGTSDPAMAAIEAAARAAHAHEFIAALPDGYDTMVGELGVTLSGGQRQRLAIARALLKNAPILILDEATSALDSESERLVQNAIDHLMEGRTTLVIAHRLATIRRASRIAVVDGGRIVETGSHEELLARPASLYRRLHEQQALRGLQREADSAPAGEVWA